MKTVITIFFLSIAVAQAQFTGFPIASNHPNADANYIATNFHPMAQLYSAVVERVSIVDNGTGTIEPLSTVSTYLCGAGTNVQVVTNGSLVYTNILLLTTNVTVTNCFTNYVYTYTDASGAHSATGVPFVTRGMLADIDSKIDELYPYFICRTISSNNDLSSYFTTNKYNTGDNIIPRESKAGMFSRIGIGYTTNLTTNMWGFVIGGDAYYSRQPATVTNFPLAEGVYTTNGWHTRTNNNIDLYYYKTNLPVITYHQGGTNQLSAIDIYVAGAYLNQSDQTTVATSKTYTVNATNYALDLVWYSVTNISSASASANSNDVYALRYINPMLSYGSASDKYILTANDYDERFRVLTNLVWTRYEYPENDSWTHPGISSFTTGRYYNGATRIQGTNWLQTLAQASNAVEAATNWTSVTNLDLYNLDAGVSESIEAYWTDSSPDIYDIYIDPALSGSMNDVYEGIANIPTNGWKIQLYRRAVGEAGVTTNTTYYYNFGSPGTPLYYEKDVTITTPSTATTWNSPQRFWINPCIDLPEPDLLNAYKRFQTINNVLFIFDWSAGLKYK